MRNKLYKGIILTPEWTRIQRYKLSKLYERFRILRLALQQRSSLFISLFLIIAISYGIDILSYSYLNKSFIGFLFSELQYTQEVLAAVITGLSAILGLLVTIYVFGFQMSAERFNATDRMMNFFRTERVSNIVLDFTTVSIIYSLITLLALGIKNFTPYISVIVSLIMAIVSITLIVVYFRRAIELTSPGFVFNNIAEEIKENLELLVRNTKHGPSVETHLRESVSNQLDQFQEFIKVFAAGSKSKDLGKLYKEGPAAEGMVALLGILQLYVDVKRLIPEKSLWFSRREVPMPSDGTYDQQRLVRWANIKALGQLPETTIENNWLETRLLSFTNSIFSEAVDEELSLLLTSIPFVCREILLTALKVQEFSIFKMVAEQTVFPYLDKVFESKYPTATEEVYELIWSIWRAILQDDEAATFRDNLPSFPWLTPNRIKTLKIPALFKRDVLLLEDMLEYETLIDGKRISPDSEIIRFCNEHSITEVIKERQAILRLFHSYLTNRINTGIKEKDRISTSNALYIQLILVRQVLLRGPDQIYQELSNSMLSNLNAALPILIERQQDEPEVLPRLVNETFHYLINLIHLHRSDNFQEFLTVYIQSRVADTPKENEIRQVNEDFILLGTITLIYSEFYSDPIQIGYVLAAYQTYLNLNNFTTILETYLKHWQLRSAWIIHYFEYFEAIQTEMLKLPERYIEHPGRLVGYTIPDHPSLIIQRLADHYGKPLMEGGAYYLYLRICELIGKKPDDEVQRLHP